MPEHNQRDVRTSVRNIRRYSREGIYKEEADLLIAEFAATIYLNDQELVTLLCTPGHLEDLAVGFLAAEGLLPTPEDLELVIADYHRGQIWVRSKNSPLLAERNFLKRCLTTGCGKGTTFINPGDIKEIVPLKETLKIRPEQVNLLLRELQERSELFRATGGVHSSALCSSDAFILYREDLGRHNAVDKIIGHCWRQGIDPGQYFLVTSGRISSEILLKSAKMGIQILVSRSAPTSLAVDLAEQLGVTVIGFARGGRFNVYSHPGRLKL